MTLENLARKVVREEERLLWRYRPQVRRLRRWARGGLIIAAVLFYGLGLFYMAVNGVEKLLALENAQARVFWSLVNLFARLTGLVSVYHAFRWIERATVELWSLTIVPVAGVALLIGLGVAVIWKAPRVIIARANHRKTARQALLQEAIQPVPSRRELAARFGIVVAVVWIGLLVGDRAAAQLGFCLSAINRGCGNADATSILWVSLALVSAALATAAMHHARAHRAAARRELLRFRGSILRRYGDVVLCVLTALGIVAAGGAVLLLAI